MSHKTYPKCNMRLLAILACMFVGCNSGDVTSNRTIESTGHRKNKSDNTGERFGDGVSGSMTALDRFPDGQTFVFSPADYRGGWLSSVDTDLIKVFILDAQGANEAPAEVKSLAVLSTDGAIFTLDPIGVNDDGKSAIFGLDNRDLAIAIQLGSVIEMEIGDQLYRAEIPRSGRPKDSDDDDQK